MKRLLFVLLLASVTAVQVHAFKTQGDGTVWSMAKLTQAAGSGVTKTVSGDTDYYVVSVNDTIAVGDSFKLDGNERVLLADGVTFVVEGDCDMSGEGALFSSDFINGGEEVKGIGVCIANPLRTTTVENCRFDGVGLKCLSPFGLCVKDCEFSRNNGRIGQAALLLGPDGASFEVTGCYFDHNTKAAIAGAANYHNPLVIKDCTFTANGQANGNTPQLNLTVALSLVIDHCTIEGDPELTMVGGIGLSNFMGATDTKAVVRNCCIRSCRYGIGTVGPVDISIENNELLENHYELNAMNGGSGISLYDPYNLTTARITGNRIEGSLWGVTVIGCKDVNLGRIDVPVGDLLYNPGMNSFKDNGNGGELYDFYNNSAITVYAQGNTWNVSEQSEEQIETVVFHQHDNPNLGQVVFMPPATASTIDNVEWKGRDRTSYSLRGHRQEGKPLHGGIYIVDGKKRMGR